jgi:hypothetical protein
VTDQLHLSGGRVAARPIAQEAEPMPRSAGNANPTRTAVGPVAGLLLVLLGAASACGSVTTASPVGSTSPVAATVGSTAAPVHAGLPAGFPIMPGAAEDSDPPAPGAIGAWHADADSGAVYEYYLAELPRAGFVVDGRYPGGAAAVIVFTTSSGQQLQLALEAANGGTDFQVLPPDPG